MSGRVVDEQRAAAIMPDSGTVRAIMFGFAATKVKRFGGTGGKDTERNRNLHSIQSKFLHVAKVLCGVKNTYFTYKSMRSTASAAVMFIHNHRSQVGIVREPRGNGRVE